MLEQMKSYKLTCATNGGSDQTVHLRSMIRVFAVNSIAGLLMRIGKTLITDQTADTEDADAQTGQSLRFTHIGLCRF